MATMVERIIEEVKTLTPEEQQQVAAFFGSGQTLLPQKITREQQRKLAERLLADGLLDHIPQDAYTEAAQDKHEPFHVIGRPLSETLLEDRE